MRGVYAVNSFFCKKMESSLIMSVSTSPKYYLVKAMIDWCCDNGHTPYMAVQVDEHTTVPMAFVQNHQIVLNLSATATQGMTINPQYITFSARFGGVAQTVKVPIGHILSIFAKETGEGMPFHFEPLPTKISPTDTKSTETASTPTLSPEKTPPTRPHLRIIK
jgi:stringent starvation protein B